MGGKTPDFLSGSVDGARNPLRFGGVAGNLLLRPHLHLATRGEHSVPLNVPIRGSMRRRVRSVVVARFVRRECFLLRQWCGQLAAHGGEVQPAAGIYG
jgi:hypothetical protein